MLIFIPVTAFVTKLYYVYYAIHFNKIPAAEKIVSHFTLTVSESSETWQQTVNCSMNVIYEGHQLVRSILFLSRNGFLWNQRACNK
jgi:hypothetical protein